MSQPVEPTVLPVTLSAKTKLKSMAPEVNNTAKQQGDMPIESLLRSNTMPIDYKNGRKQEPKMFNFTNYYNHRERLPRHYHPLVQFLNETECKYHNDNLYANSVMGFPTRAQILKERKIHLPILKDTPVEKARFARKKNDTEERIMSAKKKYRFQTYDGYSDHYFLTGARFNR